MALCHNDQKEKKNSKKKSMTLCPSPKRHFLYFILYILYIDLFLFFSHPPLIPQQQQQKKAFHIHFLQKLSFNKNIKI